MKTEDPRIEAVRIAEGVLSGEIELVPGCRAVQRPLVALGLRMDEEFTIFIGVDSEADEFPFGDERNLWSVEALRRADAKLKSFDTHYRPLVAHACQKLIARLG